MNRLLDRFDHFLIDLDGVVYLGDQPTLCAAETFTALNDAGKRRLFITNDPRHTAQGYATKLARLGIPADPAEFLTSGRAAALYLQREGKTGRPIFVVGSDGLRSEIEAVGGHVLKGNEGVTAEIVVVGGHEHFSYQELKIATLAIQRGAAFIATNRDANFPMPDGLWPGTGPIVAAIEVATGITPVVVGKPEKLIFEIALDLFPPAAAAPSSATGSTPTSSAGSGRGSPRSWSSPAAQRRRWPSGARSVPITLSKTSPA
ncbi:MAG: HAD-IIA family hydrolase [Candidatus Manganitrophus sp.]|nr:HAD-IIA family hydrolase [Candidatus Manganitrophus sp.]WDT71401.1 MAG: HAD-IIA family hydrolase [Candidatus Manganitrophus sp.]WDT81271.1 MAG: HAD-IIA family hydrolase [Candidatus Manganitrophus sp.]